MKQQTSGGNKTDKKRERPSKAEKVYDALQRAARRVAANTKKETTA